MEEFWNQGYVIIVRNNALLSSIRFWKGQRAKCALTSTLRHLWLVPEHQHNTVLHLDTGQSKYPSTIQFLRTRSGHEHCALNHVWVLKNRVNYNNYCLLIFFLSSLLLLLSMMMCCSFRFVFACCCCCCLFVCLFFFPFAELVLFRFLAWFSTCSIYIHVFFCVYISPKLYKHFLLYPSQAQCHFFISLKVDGVQLESLSYFDHHTHLITCDYFIL